MHATILTVTACIFILIPIHALAAKFGGRVPGTIMGRRRDIVGQITTLSTSESAHAKSPDASDSSANAGILDIVTYTIIAIAGCLILLLATASVSTTLFFHLTKDKRRTR